MIKQRQKNRVYDVSHSRLQDNLRGKDNASDSGGEETELFVRNKSPKKDIPTVEKLVQDGDTLQSLAIRYHCTIEELKRLNNIHKENEIFARTTIRVPHRPFAMALAGVHSSGTTSPIKDLPSSSKIVDITSLNSRLKDSILIPQNGKNVNEIIFNSNIVQKPSCERLEEVGEELNEEACLLQPQREMLLAEPVVSKLNCNGADCGISWVALIICIVILIFAVPLILLFYVAEHHHDHDHTHYQNHDHIPIGGS
ncbi:unnamed protein product [Acanthoscelides obtectus]|uniref:LysM domain-containing protein n=1 Tax=Acanthoscelides obtectus TaxID=200917 RepID=A0A9P0K6H7_ACAOB|nr:unnamed protein product [Acanthoscelides obtectus]CAK1667386.1 LysM and putative peptidoglycan-binding domain-containing protein 3 [Acanthoscelides obtectus]